MRQRRPHRRPHRSHRRSALASVFIASALVIAACGGDDDSGDSSAAADESGSDAADEPAADAADEPAADGGASAGAGTAEVTVDDVTHRYADLEGITTFCTSIGGSLQAGLAEVDDAGAAIPEAELTLYLLEADADPSLHSPPSIEIELADGTKYSAGDVGAGLDTPPVALEPDGRAASGTVQLIKDFDAGAIVEADLAINC